MPGTGRSIIAWSAVANAGISGEMVRDPMVAAVEAFGQGLPLLPGGQQEGCQQRVESACQPGVRRQGPMLPVRVLRKDGTPFPNLFAGGGAARGLSGPSDWGYLSGSGLMTATNMGRLAGIAAAKLVKK